MAIIGNDFGVFAQLNIIALHDSSIVKIHTEIRIQFIMSHDLSHSTNALYTCTKGKCRNGKSKLDCNIFRGVFVIVTYFYMPFIGLIMMLIRVDYIPI